MNRKRAFQAAVLLTITGGMFFVNPAAIAKPDDSQSTLEQGRALTFDRTKGNCLACHHVEGGELMGDYGPPLIMMKARFPDRQLLREQIWDAAIRNPDTRMPPFGRNRILTEDEIDLVTDFIQSL